ncbi:mechanosensitive ion channel family protein [Motilimonas sp. E26]|uniref:mechanosensitive ion channel family protein n=1 Tax=Motilimonas sp. E26 TaxID=2865674 RepID=UPI001E35D02C|nr:mechanosensitive ion channel family protein [Motilimonas sp. E26]
MKLSVYTRLLSVLMVLCLLGVAKADEAPYELGRAETFSPRDTIASFIRNAEFVEEGMLAGQREPVDSKQAFLRALQTMDFNATPHSDSWDVRSTRFALLKEILDRVPLPDEKNIPGVKEAKETELEFWVIPGTELRLVRQKEGKLKGHYLFSADTVEALMRHYRKISHLPYLSGKEQGLYETYIRSPRSVVNTEREIRNRLKPVDTSSPRSTLEGFLASVNMAYSIVMEMDEALTANPPTVSLADSEKQEEMARNFLRQASLTMDLSKVPSALREGVAINATLQLKEILDRMMLPPLQAVPNSFTLSVNSVNKWRYPNTRIEIVRMTDGPRAGEYLFSAETVKAIDDFYEGVAELPYREDHISPIEMDYHSPHKSEGFYEYYISTPGDLIPHTNYLGSLFAGLPKGMHQLYSGQTLAQWLGLVISVAFLGVVSWCSFRLFHRVSLAMEVSRGAWLKSLMPILLAVLVELVFHFIDNDLNFTGSALLLITQLSKGLTIVLFAWSGWLVGRAIAETIISSPRIQEKSVDASLIRICATVAGAFVSMWILTAGMRSIGADMAPLFAGLGVTGLAIALAAKRTVANLIGSIILFVNKPVRQGDFFRYGDKTGTVESIGIYSTRIRTLERSIVTIPNAEFSEMQLDNLGVRDRRLFNLTIGLRYETSPEQMRYILAKLRKLLIAHPMLITDTTRVRMTGFGACSKDISLKAYFKCVSQDEFLAIQEDVLLKVEELVEQAGSGFAFPSQTTYLARDNGMDKDKIANSELKVKSWRDAGVLPFPDYNAEQLEQMKDTLDYPPTGSAVAAKGKSSPQEAER